MTINNPDDNDYAIVRQGYPDYIRSLIHTDEVGEDGTPHIQAWIRLQKQQRMSFVKKLFPRGHFTPLAKEEHELNTRRYVQKNDDTTDGAHIQLHNDPIPDCVSILKRFCQEVAESNRQAFDSNNIGRSAGDITSCIKRMEAAAVVDNPYNAKIFVSPTYARIKQKYLGEIFQHIIHKLDAESSEGSCRDTQGDCSSPPSEGGGEDCEEPSVSEFGSDSESGFCDDDSCSEDDEDSLSEDGD